MVKFINDEARKEISWVGVGQNWQIISKHTGFETDDSGEAIPPPNPPSAFQPNTLEDVLHATRRISNILQKTDIFTSIEAHLERPRDPLARPGDVDLVFKTKERGRLYASSSTELGNNEGSAVCILSIFTHKYILIFLFSSRVPLHG
jgi:hypothetical protein